MVFQPSPPPAPATSLLDGNPCPVSRPVPGGCERELKGWGADRAASCEIGDRPAVLILRAFPYPHPTSLCVVRSTAALFFLPSFLPSFL